MFLKRSTRKKDGKTHVYWSLVESYRTARGSRQRVVAYLGELEPTEQSGWAQLGRHLSGHDLHRKPQPTLFDVPLPEPSPREPVSVRLSGVRLEHLRDFGDIWLAWGLWRMLGLDELLERIMPAGRVEVPWPVVAAILTIARFCEPSSELHIEDTWYRRTSLPELLGVDPAQIHTDRLYAGLDHLLPHKETLETHLRQRFGELFELKCDLLLYDITSTYFEGDAEGNALAKRGYSRDSRPDRPQVCIGLVVTEEGFPLAHEIFPGNTHDSTTVKSVITALQNKYGTLNRVWVMDRGLVSEENLRTLRDSGAHYIVGTPKALLSRFERELTEQNWESAQDGVDVKLVPAPDGSETFLLARSTDRQAKERAMHERFAVRLEAGLTRIRSAIESGRLKDAGLAQRRVGRLLEQNWRASQLFEITVEPLTQSVGKARLKLTWTRRLQFCEWAALSEGCYLLRSNLTDVDAPTLWRRYIQLTEAEWAFRIAKDELAIRPIWHHKEDRVRAHILVCFLAYAMWKTLAAWMQRSRLGDAPRTLLEEFARLKSGDVVLPAHDRQSNRERELRLRCVTEPDAAQRALLNRLGLTLPRRLKSLHVPEPLAET